MKTTEIMPYQTIHKLVNDYQEGVKRISAAYELLEQGQSLLSDIAKYSYVLPDNRSLYGKEITGVLNKIKSQAWEGILAKTQADKFMTHNRRQAFDKSLEKPETLPDITIETITSFVDNLVDSAPDMLLEFIKETFDWLKPGRWSMKYKTNQKSEYELDEKIIKAIFQLGYNAKPSLSYYHEQPLKAMDSAFHLMDGKGIPKNGSSAYTAIKTAEGENKQTAETEYFYFKWYKNQNCHITFKRMDLVNKMNQIAGENMLKAKSQYETKQ